LLTKLHIQNYAIIEEIEISFSPNLSVITGETGAGKSILMGALSLILGERADTAALLNREKKCIVEGWFSVNGKKAIIDFFKANDLDAEEELLIRREIAVNGKSRAFINDTPVNLSQLQELSALLVDLHRQFDTLELGETGFQREVLDALAGNADKLDQYRTAFRTLSSVRNQLAVLREQKNQFNKEADYNQYLADELMELDLKENELEDLDAALKMLNNSEGIKSALEKTIYCIGEGEMPVTRQLKQLVLQLQPYTNMHPGLPALLERLQSTQVELQDIADESEIINNKIHYDAERIEQINERISAGYSLLKKHGVQTTSQLIAIKEALNDKLKAVLDIDDAIIAQEKEVARLLDQCTRLAAAISASRHKVVAPLEQKVNALLAQVGMPNALLKADIQSGELQLNGSDRIEFLFDANKSNRFEPLRKVASGGELSRLMLCIKSLVAQAIELPTLIFDEIDTGISGEAARQVGIIMKTLSDKRQVICITHQPQIAGKANAHHFVFKEIKGNMVKTGIRLLSQEERITTIAQMLSGEKPTAAALENAREMVGN
jgi:DNA repair protein RecN (Recombination protein N)